MDISKIQILFSHPHILSTKIHVIFDVCHTKLMINLLGGQNGNTIKHSITFKKSLGFYWQKKKLKEKHNEWTKHKMNVGLVAHILSSSVATAIDFLQKEANFPGFEGSGARTDFIRKVGMAFDMLNI